jgi:hypothetical protein
VSAAGSAALNAYNTTTGTFNNPSLWNTVRQDKVGLGKFSKARLLSAYLKIRYMGKFDDRSGLIKVCMGFK